MALWNRWKGQNMPSDWASSHTSGSSDQQSWHIAVHPFCDVIRMWFAGVVTNAEARDWFDLSPTEQQQALEIVNWIDAPVGLDAKIARALTVQSVLRQVERGMFADRLDVYGKLGITTNTEDR